MNKGYQLDREYSVWEIIRYNLKMWWLALICAAVCAAALGGYKLVSLYPYLEKENYENIKQVTASLFVNSYSDESSVERANNVIKMADSYRAYEMVTEKTGYVMDYPTYQLLFDIMQGEAADVVSIYVTYPVNTGMFNMADETTAMIFANAVIEATDEIANELIGKETFTILDAPYLTSELQEIATYFITEEDFKKGVMKAITAGALLGIMVEVVLYTFWMLLCKKPKSIEEVRQCMETPIIDSVNEKTANEEEIYKNVALFLKGDKEHADSVVINCMIAQCPKKEVALKLAMSYANEQKKTLFIDLAANKDAVNGENSISPYILGEESLPKAKAMNKYLDAVCRNVTAEKGFNIVMHERFAEYISQMRQEYERIIINTTDIAESTDAYAAAKLCDKTFLACGRKSVKNETLYRAKNTADVNGIQIEGVLVYEL